MVRPEVRAMVPPGLGRASGCEVDLQHLETYAPGDALIHRRNSMWILRLGAAPRPGVKNSAVQWEHMGTEKAH